jgi:hypothetical protein
MSGSEGGGLWQCGLNESLPWPFFLYAPPKRYDQFLALLPERANLTCKLEFCSTRARGFRDPASRFCQAPSVHASWHCSIVYDFCSVCQTRLKPSMTPCGRGWSIGREHAAPSHVLVFANLAA